MINSFYLVMGSGYLLILSCEKKWNLSIDFSSGGRNKNMTQTLFRNKSFSLFFLGSLLAELSEGIFGLVSIVFILKENNSVLAVSSLIVLTMLPSVFLAPVVGVILDRYKKRTILLISTMLRFFLFGLIPICIYLDHFNSYILYGVVFFSYIAFYTFIPASESVIKEILQKSQITLGTSLTQSAWQIGLLSSALLAGIMMDLMGETETFLAACLFSLVSGICFLFMRTEERTVELVTDNSGGVIGYVTEIVNGWTYLFTHRSLLLFSIAACFIAPFFSGLNILLAPFNYQLLSGNDFTVGLIDSAAGIGSLVSAFLCIWSAKHKNEYLVLFVSILFLGCTTILFSYANGIMLAFFIYLLIGILVGNFKVLIKTMIIERAEEAYIGRTMSSISMLSLLLAILFSIFIGYAGERSITLGYWLIGISLIFPVTFVVLGKKLESVKEKHNETEVKSM